MMYFGCLIFFSKDKQTDNNIVANKIYILEFLYLPFCGTLILIIFYDNFSFSNNIYF